MHTYQTNLISLVEDPIQHQDPKSLPKGYEWYQPTIQDDIDLIYKLIDQHYVEGDGLKLSYSKELLTWALTSPTQPPEWIVAVKTKDILVAFIAGLPITIEGKTSVFINFLCVHKQIRGKRLAPLMIAEVSRRISLSNVWSAYYTSADLIAQPMTKSKYYSRCLRPEAFAKLGIVAPKPIPVVQEYKLELMEGANLKEVYQLYHEQCKSYKLHSSYTLKEFKHWFQNRKDIVYTYIVRDASKVIDFVSFYSLPSKHPLGEIKVAYLLFYSCTSVSLVSLMKSTLALCTSLGFDAFNCTNIMHNTEFLDRLNFIPDNRYFYYYNFNDIAHEKHKPCDVGIYVL
jgi:glycylpeptide N-tetradecanoyltransferase